MAASQGDDGVGSSIRPEHPRRFEPGSDCGLAARLGHSFLDPFLRSPFLGAKRFFVDRPQTADTGVYLNELMSEPLEVSKLPDSARGGAVGQPLGYCRSVEFTGEPHIWTVDWLAGLLAVPTGPAAATGKLR